MRKTAKIMVIVLSIVLCFVVLGLLIGSNYMFKFALEPLAENELLENDNEAGTAEFGIIELSEEERWLITEGQGEVIKSHDGLDLFARFIPSKTASDKFAILVHGYKSSSGVMAKYAKHYYDLGWNILVPDQRAHGKSQGEYIGMGCLEKKDMLGWVQVLLEKKSQAKILLHGVSMGAATVMLLSGEKNLPQNICALVSDCGYSSVNDQFTVQLKELFGLPAFPLLQTTSLLSKIRAGYFFGEGNCAKAVSKSNIPILFIHGDKDTFVPFEMLEKVYAAASCEKEKLVVPHAEHGNAMDVNPELYWTTVDNFVAKYF
ncbi:MAG: alpha/beta hydrolase [Spirochaetaceae bacterium]|nr:alpha/beta hydrolase [Spirochaetaceae bacterium]